MFNIKNIWKKLNFFKGFNFFTSHFGQKKSRGNWLSPGTER